jgi:predicted ATPase
VLRIRAGAHTGRATPVGDEYVSLAVHIAARVAATANAGQVVVSQSVQHDLDRTRGTELGRYRLKDVPEPVPLWLVAGPRTPLRAEPERLTNIVTPRTSFVGRADELATLTGLLAEPGIVTVVGPGGLGKSRLVVEACLRLGERLPGGTWLAELAAVDDPGSVLGAVAAALGGEPGATLESVGRELSRRGDAVLVLDNCEHLIEGAAELAAELAERCPRVRLVATSREALDVDGEVVLRLTPLPISSEESQVGEAEQLFVERAASAGAALSGDDLAAVSRVCRQLDGLPLALELAAARAPAMPVSQLADALEARQLRLQRRGVQGRHRNLTELVSWSMRLLDPGERAALCVLSVFPGRFAASTAKEVLGAVPRASAHALPELTRRSLVDLDGDEYRLLSTIRDVAAQELADDPELDEAAHRSLLEWAVADCPDPTARMTDLDDFDTALAVLAALSWGLDHNRDGLHLLMRRLRYWADRTGGAEALRELGLRVMSRPTPRTPEEVHLQSAGMDVAIGIGWHLREGLVDAARIEAHVAAARAVGDAPALYQALAIAALTMSKLERHREAQALSKEALELTRTDSRLAAFRGLEVGDLALTYYFAGDLDSAQRYLQEAVDIVGELGDDTNVAVNRCNLAELMLDRGAPESAREQVLAVAQAPASSPLVTAVALALLVEAYQASGAVDEARELAPEAKQALEHLAELDPSLTAQLERFRGVLALLEGA